MLGAPTIRLGYDGFGRAHFFAFWLVGLGQIGSVLVHI